VTKASKLSDARKASILKHDNDGVPVAEICRKAWSSQATHFLHAQRTWSSEDASALALLENAVQVPQ
jgi:hypothetical protein